MSNRWGLKYPVKSLLNPLTITLIYALFGALWILFSDRLLAVYFDDPRTVLQFQTVKGWFYVLATAAILYWLMRRAVSRLQRAENALRMSEQGFRDVIESSLTGISIVQDEQVVFQNAEQERLLGPLPRPFGFTDLSIIHHDDVQKVTEFYAKAISGGPRRLDSEFRIYSPGKAGDQNELKWVICRTSSVDFNSRRSLLVLMMDITWHKEIEHRLIIEDKMSSLGRVAAGIAHEIRNPLSGINIYLDTLEKIFDRGENLDKVEGIISQLKSASRKIESVIKRVMDFSKPGEPQLVPTDLNRPIEEAINLTAVTMRKSGIKLERSLAAELPQCRAAPHLIEEVLLNLLTNAAEAMKNVEGAKRLKVSSAIEDNRIMVRVSDSGRGIPGHLRDRVFDPFYTTKESGTGIGLAICHRLIADHGGALSVQPSEWGGAEFMFTIPVKNG